MARRKQRAWHRHSHPNSQAIRTPDFLTSEEAQNQNDHFLFTCLVICPVGASWCFVEGDEGFNHLDCGAGSEQEPESVGKDMR